MIFWVVGVNLCVDVQKQLSALCCLPGKASFLQAWQKTSCGKPSTSSTRPSTRTPGRRWSWLAACQRRSPWTWPSLDVWWLSTSKNRSYFSMLRHIKSNFCTRKVGKGCWFDSGELKLQFVRNCVHVNAKSPVAVQSRSRYWKEWMDF